MVGMLDIENTVLILVIIFVISFSSFFGFIGTASSVNDTNTTHGTLTVENIGSNTLNVTIDKKRLQMDNVNLLFSDVGIATWISVNQTNFLLGPKQKKEVQFTVNVPANVNYYDAMGALVVRGYPANQTTSQSNKNMAVRRVKKSDIEKLSRATGAKVVTNIDDLTFNDLGEAGSIAEKKVSGEDMHLELKGGM